MEVNKTDVLLVGRPDHSLIIYDALCNQNDLTFKFITFKVLPKWMKKFTSKFSIQYITKNVIICWIPTVINVFKYTFGFKFAKNWKEAGMLSKVFNNVVRKERFALIHYWSTYCNEAVEKYALENPEVIALKDIHMPSFATVYKSMWDVCDRYGFKELAKRYKANIERQAHELRNVDVIVGPSEYVLNSYKELFPDKKYLLVSYGITVSKNYKKKSYVKDGHRYKFVYAGRISLEKGADLLFGYFSKHPEYELHVYGNFVEDQKGIFTELITDNIILHGNVAKSTLQDELARYDIGIHLSRFDAYSLAVGEILGCGLPVIVSNTTGIEADVRNNEIGFVTNNTVDDIERKINDITCIETYNHLIDSLHNFIITPSKTYGEKMVDLYKLLIRYGKSNL